MEASAATPPAAKPPPKTCKRLIADVVAEPARQGFVRPGKGRAELLARAKAEPVVFLRQPKVDAAEPAEVKSYREQIERNPAPGYTMSRLYRHVRNRPEVARALLLREGYLYANVPSVAAAMVDLVALQHLYREPELVILRGSQRLRARKSGRFYEYTNGPEAGSRARILLYDRVWPVGQEPGASLAVDVRTAKHALGFSRLDVRHATMDRLYAKARYGVDWVDTLFRIEGARITKLCEVVPEAILDRVAKARSLEKRRSGALAKKQDAILAMVREALPFDEPRTEEGQQDGNLRPAWRWAYNHGWDMYTFNDDHYLVFDAGGRPQVPQVCIDFITDTLERASGTWWSAKDQGERKRSSGGVDFDALGIVNRRSVDVFIKFAKSRPEWFDVYELHELERIRFLKRTNFFAHLADNSDRYRPGDVVAIFGPRNDGENHWHSFYVYDSDPVTGMPLVLAANAGRPRIRTWEAEMRSAPLRSIKARVRFRLGWLNRVLGQSKAASPPALISAPI